MYDAAASGPERPLKGLSTQRGTNGRKAGSSIDPAEAEGEAEDGLLALAASAMAAAAILAISVWNARFSIIAII